MSRTHEAASGEEGYTLVEVIVATSLSVIFFVAFCVSLVGALDSSRGNNYRQQATALSMEQVEWARSLVWDEVAMSSVDTSAPMLNETHDAVLASAAGLDEDESLVVSASGGIAPMTTQTDGEVEFTNWAYVTDAPGDLRRLIIYTTWQIEGNEFTNQSSTLISRITADENASTTTAGATTTTLPTTTTSTTTTTVPTGPMLHVPQVTIEFKTGKEKTIVKVWVVDDYGFKVNGAEVHGVFDSDPLSSGPWPGSATTGGDGRAQIEMIRAFGDGTVVSFCVTDVVLAGFTYDGGPDCVSAVWNP
jgi:hypothetical protein